MIALLSETLGIFSFSEEGECSFSLDGTALRLLDYLPDRSKAIYISSISDDRLSSGIEETIKGEMERVSLYRSLLPLPLIVDDTPYLFMTSLDDFKEESIRDSLKDSDIGLVVVSSLLLSSEKSSKEIVNAINGLKGSEIMISFERGVEEHRSLEALYNSVDTLIKGRNIYSSGNSDIVPFPFIRVERGHLREFFSRFS